MGRRGSKYLKLKAIVVNKDNRIFKYELNDDEIIKESDKLNLIRMNMLFNPKPTKQKRTKQTQRKNKINWIRAPKRI